MTTALLESCTVVPAAGRLQVAREDIAFHGVSSDAVLIEVTITNAGQGPSLPRLAAVEAAPLGAFVPWRRLGMLAVPALEPGQTTVVRGTARRRRRASLGRPDRVAPAQLLQALAGSRRPPRMPTAAGLAELPADPFELLGQSNPHWAGNLNVFVNRTPVERHLAQALRIYPGRLNLAMFVVGCGADEYAFHLAGDGAHWDAALHNLMGRSTLALGVEDGDPLREGSWIRIEQQTMMMLSLRPPQDCVQGSALVHVEQRSTGKRAVVEFSLDAHARGPGCFVVG